MQYNKPLCMQKLVENEADLDYVFADGETTIHDVARNAGFTAVLEEMGPDTRKMFQAIDTDKDGIISHQEIEEALKGADVESAGVAAMFEELDLNQNGTITYEEFRKNVRGY